MINKIYKNFLKILSKLKFLKNVLIVVINQNTYEIMQKLKLFQYLQITLGIHIMKDFQRIKKALILIISQNYSISV